MLTETTLPTDALEQTAALVFQTFLAQEVFPAPAADGNSSPELTGRVDFQGPASGALLLAVEETVARRWAARFLALPAEEIGAEDVADALGEITNMIAGNFKSAFLPGAQLLAPARCQSGPANAALEWEHFLSEDGPCRLALVPAGELS